MSISPLAVRAGIPVAIGMLAALLSTVPSLQWLALAVVIGAMGFLGLLIFRQATEAAAQRTGSDELRRMNIDLEGRAQAGTADSIDR
jgi:hypothetical protein